MTKMFAKAHSALLRFKSDKAGAALVEYSLLIGLMTVLAVAAILVVGTWIGGQWTALRGALGI